MQTRVSMAYLSNVLSTIRCQIDGTEGPMYKQAIILQIHIVKRVDRTTVKLTGHGKYRKQSVYIDRSQEWRSIECLISDLSRILSNYIIIVLIHCDRIEG